MLCSFLHCVSYSYRKIIWSIPVTKWLWICLKSTHTIKLLQSFALFKIEYSQYHLSNHNKAFVHIRLHLGIATPLAMHRHTAQYSQKCCHPLNRKYVTYCNAAREGPSDSHRGSAQQISWRSVQRFQRYTCGQTHELIAILHSTTGAQ